MDLDPHPLAVRSTVMPFEVSSFEGDPVAPLLDAVYIPTRRGRPAPETPLTLLLTHSKTVMVLCTDSAPDWARPGTDERVVVLENIESYFDLAAYKGIPANKNSSMDILPGFDIPAKRTFALKHALKCERNKGLSCRIRGSFRSALTGLLADSCGLAR